MLLNWISYLEPGILERQNYQCANWCSSLAIRQADIGRRQGFSKHTSQSLQLDGLILHLVRVFLRNT